MKFGYYLTAVLVFSASVVSAQMLEVVGNGIFESNQATRVTIKSTATTTNALVRFGNEGISKVSLGYEGTDEIFKIASGTDLSINSLTMGLSTFSNRFSINDLPSTHRLRIKHNSTSGTTGSSHLELLETGSSDFARLRFGNEGENGLWTIAARSTDGSSLLNLFYNDGVNFANVMSLDGDLFRVGIHQTAPDAFLHIKQQTAGVDALKFENDDATGGEIWGWRVGDNDILIYFEGGLRGSFNSDDGVYTNFPPPPPPSIARSFTDNKVLEHVMEIKPLAYRSKSKGKWNHRLDPYQIVEVNPEWVVESEDGEKLGVSHEQFLAISIQAIREQQDLIDAQFETIELLIKNQNKIQERLSSIEKQLSKEGEAIFNKE